ncbi:MAG: ParB N-terminal domain-containing protein [Hydrococcus sp. Prado102]|nr:ParB N-terminal domain-containing protein [Hydrococcus sp. Prado102]
MATVNIDSVNYNSNRRSLDNTKVEELMQSISANGLINPITLDKNNNLIAGLHRLTACKLLGYEQIACNIVSYKNQDRARLAEIDENLIRNELQPLERSELWLERDRILERLGQRAKSGDNQYSQQGGETISPPPKTTLELAKEVGCTERTFQYGKQIANNIVPEVKKKLEGTPIAKSTSALLKIARAGSQEREEAEQAEQAAQEARNNQKLAEAEKQTKLAAQARAKQTKLQLAAFESLSAEKQAKQTAKQLKRQAISSSQEQLVAKVEQFEVKVGSEWLLNRHLVYCGDTVEKDFREKLPSHAALAIVLPNIPWKHDYLIDEARIVAVLRSEGYIHDFCRRCQMPFRYEFVVGGTYIAICSHKDLLKPNHSINFEGIEGIVAYLVNHYSNPGNFVISPSLGHGEIPIVCERLDRICFIGDDDPERVTHAIRRWQQWIATC